MVARPAQCQAGQGTRFNARFDQPLDRHLISATALETRDGMLDQIERDIAIDGALDAEQRKKLMEIADKCPVHRTLTSEIRIVTKAVD